MKKTLLLIILALLVLTLQGCKNPQSSSESEKCSNTSSTSIDKKGILQNYNVIGSTKNIPKVESTSSSKNNNTFDNRIKVLLEQKAKEIIKNSNTKLIEGNKIISVATGDLNNDGYSDMAVAVEQVQENKQGSRTLYVLIQDANGNYIVKHENKSIILGSEDGGVWGDPFQGIEIKDGKLIMKEYGGSNFRWIFKDEFKYLDNKFMLTHSQRIDYYTGTGNGRQVDYDYIGNTIKYTSCSPANESYKPKLIYFDKLNNDKILFDTFDISKCENAIELELFPSLGWYEYDKYDKMLDLKISANKALDLVEDTIKSDMKKVQIPWTDETKANYSSLIFYIVPDYYYVKGKTTLYYFELDDRQDGKLVHTIIFSDEKGNTTFYNVDDATGKVEKQ